VECREQNETSCSVALAQASFVMRDFDTWIAAHAPRPITRSKPMPRSRGRADDDLLVVADDAPPSPNPAGT
jgi:hypothetical protein